MKTKFLVILVVVIILAVVLVGGPAKSTPETSSAWAGVGKAVSVVLYVVVVGFLLALAVVAYALVLGLWKKTQATRVEVGQLRLNVDKERLQITQQVYPDLQGIFPMLWDGQNLLDPNRGAVFTIPDGATTVMPGLAIPEQKARLLRAAGGWPGSEKAGRHLLAEQQTVHWPTRVPLRGLLDDPSSFQKLALGVTMLQDGRREVVRADMSNMVHMAVGGSSGWGKSVFLRALAYQLAKSAKPVDLAMVDLEGVTFAPFAQSGRLLYPVADTEGDALGVFSELAGELDRRRGLFARHPGVDSLAGYNIVADEPLLPVVCLVDEATSLLGHNDVESALRTLALRGRKYGLWLILAGQSWKHSDLDTAIRNQLGARLQFKAMSASQSRVLLHRSGAEELAAKGRALAWLPGRDLLELQAPWLSRGDIISAMRGSGPQFVMPAAATDDGQAGDDAQIRHILELAARGWSKRRIGLEVFGYAGGRAFDEVSKVLNRETIITTGPPGGAQGDGRSSSTTKESSHR